MNHTVLITAAAIALAAVLAYGIRAAAGGRHRAPGALVDAAILVAAGLTTLGLMGIAGAISYQHLLVLALEHGQHGWLGHAFPLSVDGVEIVASLRLLADQRIHVPSGWWPWAALIVGTAFSVFANVATAGPGLLDRVIAGWPAAAFLAAVKLLSGMLNRRTTTTAVTSPVPAAPPVAAPPTIAVTRPPVPAVPPLDRPSAATHPRPGDGVDDRTPDQAFEPVTVTSATGSDRIESDDAPADEPVTRPVAQLPADLMRRIPIQPERYRRWQTQWADLQAPDVNLDEVAERHGVGRRHLTWVRTAGQAGWLDHPDPPAYRLAALGAHPTSEANTQPHNDQPHNGQAYPGNPSGDDPAAAPAPTRTAAQLPVDLMRRIPIHHDGYRRWQAQWADLQADNTDPNTVATRHGVTRRHLAWVRAAGQAGWLDPPDPPAWRLATLATHPTSGDGANTNPHNGNPYTSNPDNGDRRTGPQPEPQPEPQPAPAGL
jgi:hypothetical protein